MLSPDDVTKAYPTAQMLGSVSEGHVSEYVTNFLKAWGLRGNFLYSEANWVTFPDEELPEGWDELVFLIEGYPFYLSGDLLIPFGTNVYHLFRDVYKPLIKRIGNGITTIPRNYYPVMRWGAFMCVDMRSFLKQIVWQRTEAMQMVVDGYDIAYPEQFNGIADYLKTLPNRFTSHFLGEKAEAVKWHVTRSQSEIQAIQERMLPLFHATWKRLNPGEFDEARADFSWFEYQDQENQGLVYAEDVAAGEPVAAMTLAIFPEYRSVECGFITTHRDERYKPYSLVTCAHIAAGWLAYEMGYDCSYSRIDDAEGAYKMGFGKLEPLLALKV